jgi:hypothetical protein
MNIHHRSEFVPAGLVLSVAVLTLSGAPARAEDFAPGAPSPVAGWAPGRPGGTNVWARQARPPAPAPLPRVAVLPASTTNSAPGIGIEAVRREGGLSRQLQPVAGGAVADFGRLKAWFASDLAAAQPVAVTTPDNQALACRPCCLALYNAVTGDHILLGQVTNALGAIAGPAQVIYSNAFDSIEAHVLYRYDITNHSLSQDILLVEQPVLPDTFRPEDTRLEVWTAWYGAEPAACRRQPLRLREGPGAGAASLVQDETADWGGVKMVPGRAFRLVAPEESVPVARSWVVASGVRYLIESVDYAAVKPGLDALARPRQPRSAGHLKSSRAEWLRSLAAAPARRAGFAPTVTARALEPGRPALVLDFVLASSVPVPPGAVSWWQAETNASDRLNGNNGTLLGGAAFDRGQVGQAFGFDGTNAYVEVPSTPALSPTGPFTVEGWINYDRITGDCGDVIVAKGEDLEGAIDWFMGVHSSARLRPGVFIPPGQWYYFDCFTPLLTNTWYHVAMVYDGATLTGYVNGDDDGNIPVSGAVQATERSLRIGAYAPVNGDCSRALFAGRIDELTLYNRALAPVEIQAVYLAGAAGKVIPNCVAPASNTTGWWDADGHPWDRAQTNVAILHNGVAYSQGLLGQGFSFDGASNYAEVPSAPGIRFSGPFSVEGWINYDHLYGAYGSAICAKGQDAEDAVDWAMTVGSAGKLRAHVNVSGSGWSYFDGATTLQTGAWYHVAMVYTGTNLAAYVNGAPDGAIPVAGNLRATGYSLRIGAYSPVNGDAGLSKAYFPGTIDELTFYNCALPGSAIAAIYSAGSAGKCKVDSDQDGLTDLQEQFLGTSPDNPDSDDDGLSDPDEIYLCHTNPNHQDSDGDGVIDQPFRIAITFPAGPP